ncbi:MAG: hypothetical protein EXR73_05365 [Myxococcales bacterium]|nr:hypothetical protein [Myxococcales bacterium]
MTARAAKGAARRVAKVEALEQRISVHDRHQLELKLELMPGEGARWGRSQYAVDFYLFAPASLNVVPDRVPRERVYSDLHNYVRLKTPELSWHELSTRADSPLVRAEVELDGALRGGEVRRFVHECKLFGTVFRATLRDATQAIERVAADAAVAGALLDETLAGAGRAQTAFRALGVRAEGPRAPERVAIALRLADEMASLAIERELKRAVVALERERPGCVVATRALDALLVEERYRRARGYPSVLDPGTDNEAYVHRAGLLKKYCQSALFLELRRFAAQRRWLEVAFAAAAGLAMAFATLIAFWAQSAYADVGLRLFLVLVVAYMLKDRIKDGARGFFTRVLERHLYDRRTVIEDAAGTAVGVCREKVEYVRARDVPAHVRAARLAERDPALRHAEAELHESVIHYRKEIMLDARALSELRGSGGLADIVRFHVGFLLHGMDEPDLELDWMDLATRKLGVLSAAKVYHVDLVFRFQEPRRGGSTSVQARRLVLDRNGIRRLEGTDAEGRVSREVPVVGGALDAL